MKKKYIVILLCAFLASCVALVANSKKDELKIVPNNSGWTEYSNNPVIAYKDMLSTILWNDPSVLKDGNVYKMWLSGGEPFAKNIIVKIYYATSTDGIKWDLNKTPVLTPTKGEWDAQSLETPSVTKVGNTYHMYYTGYKSDFKTGIYSLGHATSSDGIHWKKDPANPIIEPQQDPLKWGFYTSAEPAIIYHKDKFYLYYVGAKSNYPKEGAPFGILLSTSPDGSKFTEPKAAHLLTTSYDPKEYRGYSTPSIYIEKGIFHLYHDVVYNPDGFDQVAISSATSTDGINFKEEDINIFTINGGDWKDHSVLAPTVILDGGTIKMWFAGRTNKPQFNYGIGYATKISP